MQRQSAIRLLLSTLLAVGASGCSSIEEDVCDQWCECERCSEWQYDDCVRAYEYNEDDADYWDCEDAYDAWMECQEATGYCRDGHYHTDCGVEHDRFNHCVRYVDY